MQMQRRKKKILPEWFVAAMELAPEAHADVQCIIQRWIDSSISKTVNAPRGYTVEQVKVYMSVYIKVERKAELFMWMEAEIRKF